MRTSVEVAMCIKELLKEKGMTAAELARRTNMNRSIMTRYFKGERKIPMDEIPKFAKALDVTPEDLLLKDVSCVVKRDIDSFRFLNLYGEVYCGEGEVYYGEPIEQIKTPKEWLNSGEYFYLLAKGDSMIGARIHENDLLLIRRQPSVENGEIAAVVVDNKRMLKRVYKNDDSFTLVSENPNYPPITYKRDTCDNIRILGKLKKVITDY